MQAPGKNLLRWTAAMAVLLMAIPAVGSSPTFAQGSRTFPETGKTVQGQFLAYWNTHGGLAQQGYPISNEMQERSDTDGKTYQVQYFERAVFELHLELATADKVLLSLLGNFLYSRSIPAAHRASSPTQARARPTTARPTTDLAASSWLTGTATAA